VEVQWGGTDQETSTMTLYGLMRAQARDDRSPKLGRRRHEVREADLLPGRVRAHPHGFLDRCAADAPEPRDWIDYDGPRPRVLIGFTTTWSSSVVGYDPRHPHVCPGCGDQRLRPHEFCVVCSKSPAQRRRWPMMDRHERAKILAGPAPLLARVEVARTRRQKRALQPA
jgi:predicted Fe-S protein YdhL (DUF1289 family)